MSISEPPARAGLFLCLIFVTLATAHAEPQTVRPDERGIPMFSVYYKGFVIQQTEEGWIILNFPTWAPFGPTSPGPYSTEGIAKHQIDRLLESQAGSTGWKR